MVRRTLQQNNDKISIRQGNRKRSDRMPEPSERVPAKHYPKFEPLSETLKRVMENISKRTGIPELRTGLEVLDKGIFGLHKSELTTLAARPGQGKTSMACNIAWELAEAHHKVAFLSLEMSKENILERMFCAHHNVDLFHILIGKLTQLEKDKLESFKNFCDEMPLKIIDDYCFTEKELYTLVEYLEFRPDVLILDHLQHIRTTDTRISEREHLNNYLRYLKEIAMKYKIAVLCLSQINREGEEKPSLSNLKGTGSIEELSDHVLLLSLDKSNVENMDNGLITANVHIAKNRFGPTCKMEALFNGSQCKFVNKEFWQKESS